MSKVLNAALVAIAVLAGAGCGGGEPAAGAAATPDLPALPGPDAGDGLQAADRPARARDVDGAEPALVRPFPAGPSGQIVFESDIGGRPKIFLLDLAEARVTPLTFDTSYRDERPVWSPDGRRIAFSSTRSGSYDLWVMNADGSDPVRMTDSPAPDQDPSWSPDGRSLYFTSERDGRGELYRVELDSGDVERITAGLDRSIMPAVSPDGRRLAYAAQLLIGFQIHVRDLVTGETRRITSGGGACRPAWSPDGDTLAYVSLDREPSSLMIGAPDGSARRPLVSDDELWSYYPAYSPDGRWVAFSVSPEHHEGEDWDLALAAADGSGRVVRLTTGPGNDRLPDWRPSSRPGDAPQ